MIPTFPNFKKLELADRHDVERFTRGRPPSSDFNFAGLWCWDTDEQIHIAQLDGHLVMRSVDYQTGEPFYTFTGPDGEGSCGVAAILLDHAAREGLPPQLRLIPEHLAGSLRAGGLEVAEDPDNHDYILSVERLERQPATAHSSPMTKVRRFLRERPTARAAALDFTSPCMRQEMAQVAELWARNKGETNPKEEIALARLVSRSQEFRLAGTGAWVAGRLAAFQVYELLADGYAMAHFIKYDRRIRGLSEYLTLMAAGALRQHGCQWFNYEQDLGIPGLRMHKRGLQPVAYLKKYIVTKSQGGQSPLATRGQAHFSPSTGEK